MGTSAESFSFSEKVIQNAKVQKSNNPKKFGDYTANLLMLLFAENKEKLGIKSPAEFAPKLKEFIESGLSKAAESVKITV